MGENSLLMLICHCTKTITIIFHCTKTITTICRYTTTHPCLTERSKVLILLGVRSQVLGGELETQICLG